MLIEQIIEVESRAPCSNLKNFVFSNGSENLQNVIQMVFKQSFFPKLCKNLPSGWVLRLRTPIASGGWWLRLQAQSVTRLSCTNLLTASPNFDM